MIYIQLFDLLTKDKQVLFNGINFSTICMPFIPKNISLGS